MTIRIGPSILQQKFLDALTALCSEHHKFLTGNCDGIIIRETDPDFKGRYAMNDYGDVYIARPESDDEEVI